MKNLLLNTIFKRKKRTQPAKQTSEDKQGRSVHETLLNGLGEMERQCVDRMILTMYESEPDESVKGRWIDIGREVRYYPFEMLNDYERQMILDGKTYKILSLVRENVGGVVKYNDKGVEICKRTYIGRSAFLPTMKPESELNYVTYGGVYTGEALRQFAEDASQQGWTPEGIGQKVKEGIEEYHEVTRRLMKNAGVYDALEKMEQRQSPLIEILMSDVRKRIKTNKK